jgi:hypothetical protein
MGVSCVHVLSPVVSSHQCGVHESHVTSGDVKVEVLCVLHRVGCMSKVKGARANCL